jgi:hypothetical protein
MYSIKKGIMPLNWQGLLLEPTEGSTKKAKNIFFSSEKVYNCVHLLISPYGRESAINRVLDGSTYPG